MSPGSTSPHIYHRQPDWVREYLSRQDDSECDENLKEVFEDLQNTVAVMLDSEIAKKVREVERKGYYKEPSAIPAKHKPASQESSESESEPELKPQPLFFEGRATTYHSHPGLVSSSPRSSSERPTGSSFDTSSSVTLATTTSPEISSKVPIFGEGYINNFNATVAPPIPRKNRSRNSGTERRTFPPRRSSRQVKANMQQFTNGQVPDAPARHRERERDMDIQLLVTSLKEPKPAATHSSLSVFHNNLGSSRPLPPFYNETRDALLQQATTSSQLSTPSQPSRAEDISSSTAASSPFTKVWSPPPYTPTRSRKPAIPKGSSSDELECLLSKLDEFLQDCIDLRSSASASAPAVVPSEHIELPDASEQDEPADKTERKDSFSLIVTRSKRDSLPFKKRPENKLTLAIPKHSTPVSRAFGAGPEPLDEQLDIGITDGLKTLRCVDEKDMAYGSPHLALAKPMKCQGSIRRIASAASGELQKRLSVTFSNNEARNGITSCSDDSLSCVTMPSNAQSEVIVHPNSLRSDRVTGMLSIIETALPIPTALRAKRPRVEVIEESPMIDISSHHRLAMELERAPIKAARVLGSINAWADIEAKQEVKRAKLERRAKEKRRFNMILEVASKVLELG